MKKPLSLFFLFSFSLFPLVARSENVLEKSLCISSGANCVPLIKKGTPLPTSHSETFTNQSDNQSAVRISLYQGEDANPEKNKLIGNFDLPITQAAKGKAQVQVTLMIDASKRLTMATTDLESKKSQGLVGGFVQ
ncbi:MAG: Hsp70 family protein [bacterium]